MRRKRNAKIVATLGPASSTEAGIAALFEAGADVFRLNFSHGTHESHEESFDIIRGLEKRYARAIGIIAIITAGLGIAFSEGGSGARKLLYVVLGLSVAFAAGTWGISFLGFGGGSVL